ncbi:MAG: hypothetical protein ABSG31_18805, partial [Tepidisphaeraceae bacterium]
MITNNRPLSSATIQIDHSKFECGGILEAAALAGQPEIPDKGRFPTINPDHSSQLFYGILQFNALLHSIYLWQPALLFNLLPSDEPRRRIKGAIELGSKLRAAVLKVLSQTGIDEFNRLMQVLETQGEKAGIFLKVAGDRLYYAISRVTDAMAAGGAGDTPWENELHTILFPVADCEFSKITRLIDDLANYLGRHAVGKFGWDRFASENRPRLLQLQGRFKSTDFLLYAPLLHGEVSKYGNAEAPHGNPFDYVPRWLDVMREQRAKELALLNLGENETIIPAGQWPIYGDFGANAIAGRDTHSYTQLNFGQTRDISRGANRADLSSHQYKIVRRLEDAGSKVPLTHFFGGGDATIYKKTLQDGRTKSGARQRDAFRAILKRINEKTFSLCVQFSVVDDCVVAEPQNLPSAITDA